MLLKLKGKDLPFLPLGNSNNIEVGTRIAVIGSPLGLEGTMSEGIVSAVRELDQGALGVQITAAISPGSSGSPVLNAKGEVIGVASALINSGQALNFAVPIRQVENILTNLVSGMKPRPLASVESRSAKMGAAVAKDADFQAWLKATCPPKPDLVEALKLSKTLVTHYPDSAGAYWTLGDTYLQLNFINDAIVAFQQAIKISPEYARAWSGLGMCYLRTDRIDEAIGACRRAVKIDSGDPLVWYDLARCYKQAGLETEAVQAEASAKKAMEPILEKTFGPRKSRQEPSF